MEECNLHLEELKEKNNSLGREIEAAANGRESLVNENAQLKQEQQAWQERLRVLLGKMDDVS